MNTEQIIQERLKVLPQDIKQAITKTNLANKFANIAEKHGLHIDQNGNLQTETLLVMLGLEPTSDFVENLRQSLDISLNEARSIADDVNKEIFYSIRTSLEKIQLEEEEAEVVKENPIPTPPAPALDPKLVATPIYIPKTVPPTIQPTTVEQAGRFTIENPPVGTTQYNDKKINKDAVMKKIEDPEIVNPEQLLTTPVVSIPQVEVKKVESKPYAADPYRESI